MQLDDVIATTSPDHARIKEAMERSVRWLDRCIDAHKNPETQNLFCIIQGGLDLELRKQCCEEMVARDTPGIAIGGLSGGEAKEEFCKVYVVHYSPFKLPITEHLEGSIHALASFQSTSPDMLWVWYVGPHLTRYRSDLTPRPRDTPKIWLLQWPLVRICLIVYGRLGQP